MDFMLTGDRTDLQILKQVGELGQSQTSVPTGKANCHYCHNAVLKTSIHKVALGAVRNSSMSEVVNDVNSDSGRDLTRIPHDRHLKVSSHDDEILIVAELQDTTRDKATTTRAPGPMLNPRESNDDLIRHGELDTITISSDLDFDWNRITFNVINGSAPGRKLVYNSACHSLDKYGCVVLLDSTVLVTFRISDARFFCIGLSRETTAGEILDRYTPICPKGNSRQLALFLGNVEIDPAIIIGRVFMHEAKKHLELRISESPLF